MFDTALNLYRRLTSDDPVAVIVELALIALTVNWCVGVLKGTRGTRLFKGVLVVLVVATLGVRVLAVQMGWTRLDLLYRYFLIGLAFTALIAFQPELRRAFIRAGDVRLPRRGAAIASRVVSELVKSAGFLSRHRYGGLVAIERGVGLRTWAENGTLINADISANLLNTIFFPGNPLHDLGVIIRGTRVLAANCQFPPSEDDHLDPELGSRHRAALGMSDESDALVLVVSEETGVISLADGGEMIRPLGLEELEAELNARLRGLSSATERRPRWTVSGLWRVSRRAMVVAPLAVMIWYVADQASQIQSAPMQVEIVPRAVRGGRHVEAVRPKPAVFNVVFQGSTRAIHRIMESLGDKPLRVEWPVREEYDRLGSYSAAVASLLRAAPAMLERGVSIVSVVPPIFEFTVDELEVRRVALVADTGALSVTEVRFDPPEASVTLPKRVWDSLGESGRVLRVPLGSRLANLPNDKDVTLTEIPVPQRIGDAVAERVEPLEASVSLRVVGRVTRRALRGVVVEWKVPQSIQSRYEIEARDSNELLVDMTVEGDRSVVEALTADKVVAFVALTSEHASRGGDWQSATITAVLPPGVTLMGPPRDVSFRLVERPSASP